MEVANILDAFGRSRAQQGLHLTAAVSPVLLLLGFGVGIGMGVEGWSFVASLYWSTTTITTTGCVA